MEVKMVPFMNTELIAAKDDEGQIWAGIRWMCEGIGLNENQARNERRRIQTDEVLSEGKSNLTLPTEGGNQEVLCLKLDFVPLWLAKISITPTMRAEHPEVIELLKQYQLKAKDVLANAFLSPEQSPMLPKTYLEALEALVAEVKQKEALQQQVAIQTQQITEMQPKVTYYDIVLNCKELVSTSTIAKDYGWSATRLNRYLHEAEIQYKQGKIWLLYQKYAEMGYTSTKTSLSVDDKGIQHAFAHTYWTQKGRLFIYELLKQNNILPLIECDTQDDDSQ